MTMVTRQNLLAEKVRFFISVGGIALSVFFFSFLLSLFQGCQLNVGRFVEHVEADIWVAREGTTDFLNAASILPAAMGEELAQLDGVADVDTLIVRPMGIDVDGTQVDTHLVGYEVDGGAGGPLTIDKGDVSVPGEGQVIIDKTWAKKSGLGVGDKFPISGQELDVVAISTGGDFIFSQTSHVSLDAARTLLQMDGLSTFFLLHVEDGANAEALADQIEQDPRFVGVIAFSGDEFAEATRQQIMSNITPILFVILALAFVVGVAITGLTIYNATVEKAREYGILKAIGFTNAYLFRLVLEQSLAIGLFGFVVGAGLTIVASRFVADLVPQFVTLVRWQDILLVLGTTFLMSIIAALMPVRRIARVDPVTVFQA